MQTIEARNAEIHTFILEFQQKFCEKFGVIPHIDYELEGKKCLSLDELEKVANTLVDKHLYPEGLRTRKRNRELVLVRQCVFIIARELSLTFESIGDHFGFNHATVMHSYRTMNDLLKIKDPEAVKTMKLINNGLKNKLGDDGVLQPNIKEGPFA